MSKEFFVFKDMLKGLAVNIMTDFSKNLSSCVSNPFFGLVGWVKTLTLESLLPGQHIAFIGDWQRRARY